MGFIWDYDAIFNHMINDYVAKITNITSDYISWIFVYGSG